MVGVFASPWLGMTGKVVLITGADSGIGLLFMKHMIERKAIVIAVCYTQEGTNNAEQAGAHAIQCDLTQEEQIEQAVEKVKVISNGNLFALAHCAGIAFGGFIEITLPIFYRKVMEVNFFSVVSLTHKLLPLLKAHDNNMNGSSNEDHGRIVFISSLAGLVPLPGNATYGSSKFALESYADSLRIEMSQFNIGVSIVNPSSMRTNMTATYLESFRTTYNAIKILPKYSEWLRSYSEEWLNRFIEGGEKELKEVCEDPVLVVNDLTHAVCSRFPRMRYLSGVYSKYFFYYLWVLPQNWVFRFKQSMVKLKPY